MSINLYTNTLINDLNLIDDEIDFIISKLSHFEPIVRRKFIDFLIKIFNECPKFENKIIISLIKCLKDDFWNIRMQIIGFLNDIILERAEFIKEFNNELDVLYDEEDKDVKWEILDFLFNLIIKTYSIKDFKSLVNSILNRNWIAQEKIIFLIGKLGIKKKDLIQPLTREIVLFLDHDDFLVNKAVSKAIKEIMEYHVKLFDDAFFSYLNDDTFDNIEAIENLLKFSIKKHGFLRFEYLFIHTTLIDIQFNITLTNILKKLYIRDPKFVDSLFSQLIIEMVKKFDLANYTKLRMLLKAVPQYDIYLNIYHQLNEAGKLEDFEAETLRKELIAFLSEVMPELSYLDLSEWLSLEIKKRAVNLDEICFKYNIHKSKITDVISILLKKNLISAKITENVLESIIPKSDINNDLLFLKQWKLIRKPQDFNSVIKLFIQIKNLSSEIITDLYIIIDYPKDIFKKKKKKELKNHIPKILGPNEAFLLKWNFKKHYDKEDNLKSRKLSIIALYKKKNKLHTIKKDLDILVI